MVTGEGGNLYQRVRAWRGGGIPSAAKWQRLVRVGKPVRGEQQHEFSSFSLYPAGTGTEGAVMVYLSLEATLLRDAAWHCQRAVKSPLLAFWVFPSACGQRTKPGNEQQLAVQGGKAEAPRHPPPPPEPLCGATAPVLGQPALPSPPAFVVPAHRTGTAGERTSRPRFVLISGRSSVCEGGTRPAGRTAGAAASIRALTRAEVPRHRARGMSRGWQETQVP